MKLPVSAVLWHAYRKAQTDYHDVNPEEEIERIKIFSGEDTSPQEDSATLYLVSLSAINTYMSQLVGMQILSKNIILCVLKDDEENIINEEISAHLKIVFLYTQDSLLKVCNKILDGFHLLSSWESDVNVHILKGDTIQEILDDSLRIIDCSVIILDRSYKVLGYIKAMDEEPPIFSDVEDKGYLSKETCHELIKLGVMPYAENGRNLKRGKKKVLNKGEYHTLWEQIENDGNIAGFILWISSDKNAFSSNKCKISFCASVLGRYFGSPRFQNSISSDMQESLLLDIINNPNAAGNSVRERVRMILNMDTEGEFALMCLDCPDEKSGSVRMISWNMGNTFNGIIPFVHDGMLYVFARMDMCDITSRDFEDKLSNIIEPMFINKDFTIGISNVFTSLLDISEAITQCSLAVEYAGKRRSGEFVRYASVCLPHIADILNETGKIGLPLSREYEILVKYDRENTTDLTEFLYVYLANRHNVNRTAGELFLHRNTVMKKMKKITEITGNDFDSFDDTAMFLITYHMEKRKGQII